MKTIKLCFLLLIVICFLGCASGIKLVGPAPIVTIESTTELLERGEYLSNHVTVCIDCHSTRDWNYYSGPIIPGTEGKGGEYFGKELGVPGAVYSDNITQAALGDWTDGEIIRATVSGVGKDGKALAPLMPYAIYRYLTKEDLYSIIVYIRTLKSIENEVPASKLSFPVNMFLKNMPNPAEYTENLNKEDELEYGKYVTTIAGCGDCHTPMKKGKKIQGMHLAGGAEFPLPNGLIVRSTNLTPDIETGMMLSKKDFIKEFKQYEDPSFLNTSIKSDDYNTYMPWRMYSGMTEKDLGAIYTYLKSIQPIYNDVQTN